MQLLLAPLAAYGVWSHSQLVPSIIHRMFWLINSPFEMYICFYLKCLQSYHWNKLVNLSPRGLFALKRGQLVVYIFPRIIIHTTLKFDEKIDKTCSFHKDIVTFCYY